MSAAFFFIQKYTFLCASMDFQILTCNFCAYLNYVIECCYLLLIATFVYYANLHLLVWLNAVQVYGWTFIFFIRSYCIDCLPSYQFKSVKLNLLMIIFIEFNINRNVFKIIRLNKRCYIAITSNKEGIFLFDRIMRIV